MQCQAFFYYIFLENQNEKGGLEGEVADPLSDPVALAAAQWLGDTPTECDWTRASPSFIIYHDGSRRSRWRDTHLAGAPGRPSSRRTPYARGGSGHSPLLIQFLLYLGRDGDPLKTARASRS